MSTRSGRRHGKRVPRWEPPRCWCRARASRFVDVRLTRELDGGTLTGSWTLPACADHLGVDGWPAEVCEALLDRLELDIAPELAGCPDCAALVTPAAARLN